MIFSPLEANKKNSITVSYWGDNKPSKGKECVVLSGSLWKSKPCNSKNHFICFGKNDVKYIF